MGPIVFYMVNSCVLDGKQICIIILHSLMLSHTLPYISFRWEILGAKNVEVPQDPTSMVVSTMSIHVPIKETSFVYFGAVKKGFSPGDCQHAEASWFISKVIDGVRHIIEQKLFCERGRREVWLDVD